MSTKSTKANARRNRFVGAAAVIVVIVLVAAFALVRSATPSKSAAPVITPTAQLCTALSKIAAFASTHPVTKTYPNLEQSLDYSHQQFASVSPTPVGASTLVASATHSSAGMIAAIKRIIAHDKITKSQQLASLKLIPVWRSANAGLVTWQKAHC